MRTFGSLVLLSCLALTGCSWFNHKPNPTPPPPVTSAGTPKADDLVGYLNREADRLAVIKSEDVDLVATVDGSRKPALRCFMVCEKPRNFRLTGTAVGNDVVDLGSNNDQFWCFMDEGKNPPLYYCNYTDYEKGIKVALPVPFEPEWVLQALGMAKYDPSRPYRVEAKGNTFELIEDSTFQGQPVQKVTIFNAKKSTEPSQPQVLGHVIKDAATGKVLCQATIRRVRSATYQTPQGPGNVFYPSDVLLDWPAQKISMAMKIGKAAVNQQMSKDEMARFFARPEWQKNKIDLARFQPPANPTSRDIRQAANFGN